MEAIKPVYVAPTSMDLLERCVGAHTQNANESFNSTVWRMAPKAKFAGSVVVETASHIAVTLFNEGHNGLLSIMKELGVTVGEQSLRVWWFLDMERKCSRDQPYSRPSRNKGSLLHQGRDTRRSQLVLVLIVLQALLHQLGSFEVVMNLPQQ
ncbi:hypothetical protein FOCC_FOCC016834 [Frankliniella occidentalis]|nr:hypothetical protein FOCC_FOCC016834 [Frankliniella occidentalis]